MAITTKYWTYLELKQKVERDTDTEAEIFIQPEEMLGYFNEAIDEVELEVKGLYEDYFLDRDTLTLVSGTSEYALPSKIYAHKIRRILYRNGSRVYVVRRVRDWKKFEYLEVNKIYSTSGSDANEYSYFVINSTAGAPRILFTPDVSEDGTFITIWYLRQANRLETNTDVLDVPEAANFVLQHVKTRIYEKEAHPMLEKAMADLEKERNLLRDILATMVPDADNEIEMDLSFYEEMM